MSDPNCCYAAGGRVSLKINGKPYDVRASVSINVWGFERTAENNQNGSMYVTTKSKPYTAELTFSDGCDVDLEDLKNCSLDVTIELTDLRRTHYFTKAIVVGSPSINTETGEISGLQIASMFHRSQKF